MIVSLEGCDAAGKGTQSRMLEKALERLQSHKPVGDQVPIFYMEFPNYGIPSGELIDRVLHTKMASELKPPRQYLQMLMTANRWEDYPRIAYNDSHGVAISNRYTESNFAYGMANGLSVEWLREIEKGLPLSDIVILIDVDPEQVFARYRRVKDMNEEDVQYQKKVRLAYLQLASQPVEGQQWYVVDGMKTIEEVHESVMKLDGVARIFQ